MGRMGNDNTRGRGVAFALLDHAPDFVPRQRHIERVQTPPMNHHLFPRELQRQRIRRELHALQEMIRAPETPFGLVKQNAWRPISGLVWPVQTRQSRGVFHPRDFDGRRGRSGRRFRLAAQHGWMRRYADKRALIAGLG